MTNVLMQDGQRGPGPLQGLYILQFLGATGAPRYLDGQDD